MSQTLGMIPAKGLPRCTRPRKDGSVLENLKEKTNVADLGEGDEKDRVR